MKNQKSDEKKQDIMREYYNSSEYYEDEDFLHSKKPSPFLQHMINNVMSIYRPEKRERILDLGCGWGNISLTLQKEGHNVTGLDYSTKSIDMCRKSARTLGLDDKKFVCRDAVHTEFDNASFDVVYCADLVEHLYPDVYLDMLKEVQRILKPDGKFVIYTPNPSHIIEFMRSHNIILKQYHSHVDLKSMEQLKQSLQNNHFTVKKAFYMESHLPVISLIEKLLQSFIPLFRRRNAVLAVKN
ncbi:methyltransferase domain-containing protein [Patescibacteria group bacterium]